MQQDAVKEDAGHKQVEDYLAGLGLESWASFRPQYMTGDGNNKDCEEWFFDSTLLPQPNHEYLQFRMENEGSLWRFSENEK